MNAPPAFRRQLLAAIPRLRRYARSLLFDPGAADDLVQTTLERALARWKQFDATRDLLVWVIAIAHNAFMDERRRSARMPLADRGDRDDGLFGADTLPAPLDDPGLRLDLLGALARLSLEQREPLLLVSVEQLSYAECAEVLGIPIGTVMSRVSRARSTLRALLEAHATPARPVAGIRRRSPSTSS